MSVGLALVLAWASAIDLHRMILPDVLTLGLVVAGLGLAMAGGAPAEVLADRAIGAAAGYAFLALLALLYRRLRGRDGLGLGDAKLLAAAGAWLGWRDLPAVLLAATGLALAAVAAVRLSGRRIEAEAALPFGPFLAVGFWGAWAGQAAGISGSAA